MHHQDSERKLNALQWAAYGLHTETVSLLLRSGASLDCANGGVKSVIAIALASWTDGDAAETVSRLLSCGAVATHVSARRKLSLLHLSALYGQVDSMRLLLKHGADPTLRSRNGSTALHYAARHSGSRTINLLIKHGAEVDARDKQGMTSLHVAARAMLVGNIRCLADHQADVHASDKFGRTPLMLACGWDESTVVRGAQPGGHDTLSVIGELLKLGAKVNVKSRKGLTALHFVSACGRQDAATALILAGARVEARTRARRTPLHLAAMSGRPKVVRALAGLGACVDSADRRGCSALQSAAARGHTIAVQALLELGARDGGRDVRCRTALDAAARAGHVEIVEMLVLHLADPAQVADTARTAYLRSAVNAARRHKRHDVVSVLELYGIGSRPAWNPIRVMSTAKRGNPVGDPDESLDASKDSLGVGESSEGDFRGSVRRLTVSRCSRSFQARRHA
jgi:ankyrin repeat protein